MVDWMFYPYFPAVNERGVLPEVPLPVDYLERVQLFYEQGRREGVDAYAEKMKRAMEQLRLSADYLRLRWDKREGLTNINIGIQGGFDLVMDMRRPHFLEHNLGTASSFICGAIAQYYVRELLKTK